MTLRLEYPDKYRLWSDLIQGNTDRVFVASDEALRVGARVPVELGVVGQAARLVIAGTLVGVRGRSERFPAGAYVHFPDEEIDKCRRFLGLVQTPERALQGRRSRRVPCALPVRLLEPARPEGATARNLSEVGLLLSCPGELVLGQEVALELTLDDGTPVPLRAQVTRAGGGTRLAALRLVDVPAEAAARLAACVERLGAAHATHQPLVVADDDTLILEFLTKALTRHGYSVHQANRGEEALALVRQLKPRMVLLDILMPGIDGVDVCKLLRSDMETAHVPVIFVSALEPQRLHVLAHEAGASDYLSKPVALADLINMVGTYLRD